MVKLLIIADDFTGALDTGVQFAARGAATRVVTDLAYDFTLADAEVLVMVAETGTCRRKRLTTWCIAQPGMPGRLVSLTYTKKRTQHCGATSEAS